MNSLLRALFSIHFLLSKKQINTSELSKSRETLPRSPDSLHFSRVIPSGAHLLRSGQAQRNRGICFRQNGISLLTEPVSNLSRGSVERTLVSKRFDALCKNSVCEFEALYSTRSIQFFRVYQKVLKLSGREPLIYQ